MPPADHADTAPITAPVFLAFTGNCQAMFLASALDAVEGVEAAYFGKQGRHTPFEGRSARDYPLGALSDELTRRRSAGARVVLCEQTWPLAPSVDYAAIEPILDGRVRFPNVEAFVLWPGKKYSADQLARIAPERLLRLDQAALAASSRDAEVQVGDSFGALFRKHILFDTPRHPTGLMFSHLAAGILRAEPLAGACDDIDGFARRVSLSRGVNTVFNYPIPRPITDALECEWAQSRVYRQWEAARAEFQARDLHAGLELIHDMLDAEPDDAQFYDLVAPSAWARAAQVESALKKHDEAAHARAEVYRLDPDNPAWPLAFATNFVRRQKFIEAEALVDEALQRFPNHPRLLELAQEVRVGDVPLKTPDRKRLADELRTAALALERAALIIQRNQRNRWDDRKPVLANLLAGVRGEMAVVAERDLVKTPK